MQNGHLQVWSEWKIASHWSAIEIGVEDGIKTPEYNCLEFKPFANRLEYFNFQFGFVDMMLHSCVHWEFYTLKNVIHCFEILLVRHRFWTTNSPARINNCGGCSLLIRISYSTTWEFGRPTVNHCTFRRWLWWNRLAPMQGRRRQQNPCFVPHSGRKHVSYKNMQKHYQTTKTSKLCFVPTSI